MAAAKMIPAAAPGADRNDRLAADRAAVNEAQAVKPATSQAVAGDRGERRHILGCGVFRRRAATLDAAGFSAQGRVECAGGHLLLKHVIPDVASTLTAAPCRSFDDLLSLPIC
jgi:hypothetical protein